jgi:hypothetical protein
MRASEGRESGRAVCVGWTESGGRYAGANGSARTLAAA